MCFFKPKMPQQPTPPTKPTIQETKAPEPEALAVGGSDVSTQPEGTLRARGSGSLRIDMKGGSSESGAANVQSGANRSLGTSAGVRPSATRTGSKSYAPAKSPVIA